VTHLSEDVGGDPGSLTSIPEDDLVPDMQARIHLVIDELNGHLANGQTEGIQPSKGIGGRADRETILEDFLTAEAGSKDALRYRALFHLKRIHDTIQEIASGLGAPVA
jgi:hypothetical protein